MSTDGRPTREVAYRVFAAEYEDATHSYKESDEERAPNYVVTPSGARLNRLFVVGVLTEIERVGDDDVIRARVVDPTGAFVVYAGQYQPEALAALEDADPPSFIAVTGKANTFTPDGSDRTFSSIRPESVSEVDADTRDRWVVSTARHTLDRVGLMASALDRSERGADLEAALSSDGVPPHLAAGIPRALDTYGTRSAYLTGLREMALDAARQIAGEIDEVGSFDVVPDDPAAVTDDLGTGVDGLRAFPRAPADEETTAVDPEETAATIESGASSEESAGADPEVETRNVTDTETEIDPDSGSVQEPVGTETDAGSPSAPEPASEPGTSVETETDSTEASGAGTSDPDAEMSLDEEEMYDMDEEEREAVESEFGVEFSSGSEIPDAGEADIETPAVEDDDGESVDSAGEGDDEDAEPASESDPPEREDTAQSDEPDLEDVVVEIMQDLGDGGAVERETLIESVRDTTDVEEEAVEEAIQAALMSGRCYESGDDELTPI